MRLIYVLALAASATTLNATDNNDSGFTAEVVRMIYQLPLKDRPEAAQRIIELLEKKINTMDDNPETQENPTN